MTTFGHPSNGESVPDIAQVPATKLVFHSGAHQQTYEHKTRIAHICPIEQLPEVDRSLFKVPSETNAPLYAIIVESTIFHPQGGGQPSDIGKMAIDGAITFGVLTARTSATKPSIVLHFGHFTSDQISTEDVTGRTVDQFVDAEKRTLFSRLHTAGHVLGAATRTLLESRVDNFDELKASHFPDSAACEFQGSIDGKYKPEIQTAVDESVAKDAEVRIGWWTKEDFRKRNLQRLLIPDEDWKAIAIAVDEGGEEMQGDANDEQTRIRVVDIVGAEVYPCGGTHVPTTKQCGKVTVKKISRSKGNSRMGRPSEL
ncbi:hypothetical protein LTS10_006084 [Elasticomyces elasticus]|nr:hypothetical protein LTS10_006084 [Elasticomyces elasticus]